jgi:hypothetical protein
MVAGHKEWAPVRKPDPHSLDMDQFRDWVRQARSGHHLAKRNTGASPARTVLILLWIKAFHR